eukprot:763111-Hanusia_phi.AAC.2
MLQGRDALRSCSPFNLRIFLQELRKDKDEDDDEDDDEDEEEEEEKKKKREVVTLIMLTTRTASSSGSVVLVDMVRVNRFWLPLPFSWHSSL